MFRIPSSPFSLKSRIKRNMITVCVCVCVNYRQHRYKNLINPGASDMSLGFGRFLFLLEMPEQRGKCINNLSIVAVCVLSPAFLLIA